MARLEEFKSSLECACEALEEANSYLEDAINDLDSDLGIVCQGDEVREAHKIIEELLDKIATQKINASY